MPCFNFPCQTLNSPNSENSEVENMSPRSCYAKLSLQKYCHNFSIPR